MTTPPADHITLNRDQLAALLAHHADTIAARWRESPGRGAWVAASALDSHAAELTADEETPAVAELLDSMLSFEVEHRTAPSAPTDGDLRDRIRRAICEASGFEWAPDWQEADEYGEHADAVLAVLPAPAGRAAALNEAADAMDAHCEQYGVFGVGDRLRRMADEAQPAEAEAHPTKRRWVIEILDGDEWMPASSFRTDRSQALAQLHMARKQRPLWSDNTPVQRRFVRETTTYTVEAEHTPEPT